jgi:CRP-like cAMP-binding protein
VFSYLLIFSCIFWSRSATVFRNASENFLRIRRIFQYHYFPAQKTVRERLAEILLLLEQKLGVDPEGFIKISLTREEIANIIGTATESAIRLISEFKQDSLIEVDGRNIKILNHDKLMKLGHVVL